MATVKDAIPLVDAVSTDQRPTAQGRSDFVMNIAGAAGGVLAGPVIQAWGMPALAAIVCAITLTMSVLVWQGLTTTTPVHTVK